MLSPAGFAPHTYGETMKQMKFIVAAAAFFVAIIVASTFVHIVPSGHRGVVKQFGAVDPTPLSEGFHVLNPLATVKDFNVRFQSATAAKAEGGTSDLQEVFEDLTLNYEYDPARAPYIYNNFGTDDDIESKFILPALYESFKAVTAQYTAEQLVTERAKVSAAIVTALQAKLTKYGVKVSDINVTNFHFDSQFAAAVSQKVVAGQQRLTAEQNLEAQKVSAQTAVVNAEADAEARIAAAKADAETIRIRADATAKAITVQEQALAAAGGDRYLAMLNSNRWNGELPAQWSGSAIPFVNFAQK